MCVCIYIYIYIYTYPSASSCKKGVSGRRREHRLARQPLQGRLKTQVRWNWKGNKGFPFRIRDFPLE